MPEMNDKNADLWSVQRPVEPPTEMTEAQAREWAELADRERAESPDGKTGWDRLEARQPRLRLTLQYDGGLRIKLADPDDVRRVVNLLERVAGSLSGRELAVGADGVVRLVPSRDDDYTPAAMDADSELPPEGEPPGAGAGQGASSGT